MPRQRDFPEDQVKTMLETYVFPKDCHSDLFPSSLRPEVVSPFIRKRVDSKCLEFSMGRATRLARFYVLRDCAGQLAKLLVGGEKSPADIRRSCYLIVSVAELGTPAEQQAAAQAFEQLVAVPAATEVLDVLITTFFSLPARVPADPLKKRIHAALEECERSGPEGKLGELMSYDIRRFPWAVTAKGRKDFFAGMKPGPERLLNWTEAYLGFKTDSPFNWEEQAGVALLADAREQGDQAAIIALRTVMAKIDPSKEDAELVKFRKTRGYRARAYFLEKLDEEQSDDQKASLRPQDDLIM